MVAPYVAHEGDDVALFAAIADDANRVDVRAVEYAFEMTVVAWLRDGDR